MANGNSDAIMAAGKKFEKEKFTSYVEVSITAGLVDATKLFNALSEGKIDFPSLSVLEATRKKTTTEYQNVISDNVTNTSDLSINLILAGNDNNMTGDDLFNIIKSTFESACFPDKNITTGGIKLHQGRYAPTIDHKRDCIVTNLHVSIN